MPLTFAEKNQTYTIQRIKGKDAARAHLREMGVVENETVSICQSLGGHVIVEIKGIRIALSEALARRVEVSRTPAGKE